MENIKCIIWFKQLCWVIGENISLIFGVYNKLLETRLVILKMHLFFIHSLGFYLSFVLFDFLFTILPSDDLGNYIAHLIICIFVYMICLPVIIVVFLLNLFFHKYRIVSVIYFILYFFYGMILLFNINSDVTVFGRESFVVLLIALFSVVISKAIENFYLEWC